MKQSVIALYFVVVVVMAAATIVERYQGTDFVAANIYGAWWFSLLWGVLTALSIFYFIRRRVRQPSTIALHLSFVIILAGALLTHLTSRQGIVHLRVGTPESRYATVSQQQHALPFTITLKRFDIRYHEGTQAAADYVSHIVINNKHEHTVSMNNIVSYQGIRLYQSSYDPDLQGSILALNSDPWGIPVTYSGYALLFIALVWMLIDPRGIYRQLLRRTAVAVLLCVLCGGGQPVHAAVRTLPQETADRFGRLFVVYNDRVCPMETYALDFTKKLCGSTTYGDYSALQVLTGFIFFYDDWAAEPIIRVKSSEMTQRLGLTGPVSLNRLFSSQGYSLGPYLDDKGIRQIDERVSLILQLHQGTPLRLFPYSEKGTITWYAPTSNLPETMDKEHQKYMREVFTLLNAEVQAGRYERAGQFLARMQQYQLTFGQRSIPSAERVKAEHLYNKLPFATILFMVCLTLAVLSFLLMLFAPRIYSRCSTVLTMRFALAVALLALTFGLVLRWVITSHIPMANGYETMLFLAWLVMLFALLMSVCSSHLSPLITTFGLLLSGFFLLVSHIAQMDPQITHLMPVLNSPLLTIHVSIIMMAYALLSLTFIISLTALVMQLTHSSTLLPHLERLSLLLLYPALACLGAGIFIGAIWANVSWGNYWSWDPKETWALITFMVYAVPAHRTLKLNYHLYMALAFLTILMTYFGVNYFLGGMHSYA